MKRIFRTGYLNMRRLDRDETRWFASGALNEFGLWYLTLHGFGLRFSIIGPFRLNRTERAA